MSHIEDGIEIPVDVLEAIRRPARRSVSRSRSVSQEPVHGRFENSPKTRPTGSPAPADPMKRKREIYSAAFDKYDVDKSGTIDLCEFHLLLKDLQWDLTPAEITEALEALDTNKNGKIGLNEFLNWSEVAWNIMMGKPERGVTPRQRPAAPTHVVVPQVLEEEGETES